MDRRTFIAAAAALAAAPGNASAAGAGSSMYGLIGKMRAKSGRRSDLIALLLEGVAEMPGCLSYIVAEDPSDLDMIWITEAWESKEAHDASLSLPAVKAVIARARPLIADMVLVSETRPKGGVGLGKRQG